MVDVHLTRLVHMLQQYEPERIILFGSHARGEADEYSDYDVLVIKRTERLFLERLVCPGAGGYSSATFVLVKLYLRPVPGVAASC